MNETAPQQHNPPCKQSNAMQWTTPTGVLGACCPTRFLPVRRSMINRHPKWPPIAWNRGCAIRASSSGRRPRAPPAHAGADQAGRDQTGPRVVAPMPVVDGGFGWTAWCRLLERDFDRRPETPPELHVVASAGLLWHRIIALLTQPPSISLGSRSPMDRPATIAGTSITSVGNEEE